MNRGQGFTTPGAITFNVPSNVAAVYVSMTGAGGSGGGQIAFGGGRSYSGVAGGGAGEWCRRVPLIATPGGTIAGVVGTGGARGVYTDAKGQDGTATSFGIYTCQPGAGGQINPAVTLTGSTGGGFGARPAGNFNNTPGQNSGPEYINWNFGASGGGSHTAGSGGSIGQPGGACEGQIASVGGTDGHSGGFSFGGGSGGGSSPYGVGGAGGDANAAGQDAQGYGAGGGGPGGDFAGAGSLAAGAGGDGYILVEWDECS